MIKPKKKLAILLCAAGLIFINSCSKNRENIDVESFTKDNISAEALWTRIYSESKYTSYKFWPDHQGMHPGQAPHGPFHKVYINNSVARALPVQNRTIPYGGIIVKENYSKTKELAAITVMVKVEGYAPENNDWFWAKYSAAGAVQAEGQPGGCISCHEGMKKNDYIIIQPLDK
jgi:hypothetical protein